MLFILLAFFSCVQLVSAHASIWHPSMWGFNVTDSTYSYDNRPVAPLTDYTFDQWWFHGHLDHPPRKEDVFELPAGQTVTTEIACNKGATSYFASSEGGDIRDPNDLDSPCPKSPMSEYHTNGPDDLKGCSLAIAYKSDVTQVQPEDFTVFSVNQTCVFHRFTNFQVPAAMPPCPLGGCICAWFWIHSQDSGGEQNYMNGFQCNITGSSSNVALAKPQLARRCGADPDNNKPEAPGNCTYGAKQPFYWFQKERNNMFEGQYSPPFYLDLYNFKDGAQDDIFQNSYPSGLPPPSPNSTFVPTPVAFGAVASVTAGSSPSSVVASSSSSSPSGQSNTSQIPASSTSSPPSIATSTSTAQISNVSATQPSSSSPSVQFSVSISTSIVVSTQVVTVTASVPTLPASSLLSAASSTVTEYSFQFVTVTAPPLGVSPPVTTESTGSSVASVPSGSPDVRAAGSSVPVVSANTIDLNSPIATPIANTSSSQLLAHVDDIAINEAVVTSVANLTAPNPVKTFTPSDASAQTCKRQPDPSSSKLTKRSFLANIPGVNRHRKWKRQPSLWQLLSPIPF